MSRIVGLSRDIAALLAETGGQDASSPLHGVPVLLWRQQDLETIIAEAVGKISLCLLVYPTSGRRKDPVPGKPFIVRHVVEVYATPLLATEGAPTADDATEAAILALDGWQPPGAPSAHADYRVVVTDFNLAPDPAYLVWKIETETKVILESKTLR